MTDNSKPALFRPAVGSRGMTELHYAAYRGDQNEIVRQLEAGVDPNIKDQYRGYTAMHWLADMAATGGPRVQMLRLLVEHGADIDALADNGATALSLAANAGSVTGEQLVEEIAVLRSRNAASR
jgi:ankyrin repeat protein